MSVASESLQAFIGARVVRGPDWKWGKQDGGDGHVGTLRTFTKCNEAVVVWDKGTRGNYRYNGIHDLRILDSGPAGVKHDSVACDDCKVQPIFGTRWKCLDCENYSLCSTCYHGDKHNLQHVFQCIDLQERTRKIIKAREESEKIPSYGLFPGARVKRGLDWQWGSQDGKLFWKSGEIKELQDWKGLTPRSAAYVVWDIGKKDRYRLGFKGKVDIKTITKAKGYSFYRDHLPVFGTVVCNTDQTIGSRVKIELDIETVLQLQIDRGGWQEGMDEALSSPGTIIGFDEANDACVLYPSGRRLMLNPAVFTLHEEDVADEVPIEVDSGLQISDDVKGMEKLLSGHDNAVDDMSPMREQADDNDGDDDDDGDDDGGDGDGGDDDDGDDDDDDDGGGGGGGGDSDDDDDDDDDDNDDDDGNDGDVGGYAADDTNYDHDGTMLTNTQQNREISVNGDSSASRTGVTSDDLLEVESNRSTSQGVELTEAAVANDLQIDETHFSNEDVQNVDSNSRSDLSKSANADNSLVELKTPTEKLIEAAAKNDVQLIQTLHSDGKIQMNASINGVTAILVASYNGSFETVQFLIESRADVESKDKDGDRAIHNAAHRNDTNIVELLAQAGADLNSRNNKNQSALHVAVNKGHTRAVRCLLTLKASASLQDVAKNTPLHYAITNKQDDILQLLLNFGAEISVKNSRGLNCLHQAALSGSVSAVKVLVAMAANAQIINEKRDDGFTALHIAVVGKHLEVAEVLIKQGKADMNAQNTNLQTPLHLAVLGQSEQIVKLLVDEGANLNLKDKHGNSALHEALKMLQTLLKVEQLQDATRSTMVERSTLILYLLDTNGADFMVKNKLNQTPLDLCNDLDLPEAVLNRHRSNPGVAMSSESVGATAVTVGTTGIAGSLKVGHCDGAVGTTGSSKESETPLCATTVMSTGSVISTTRTANVPIVRITERIPTARTTGKIVTARTAEIVPAVGCTKYACIVRKKCSTILRAPEYALNGRTNRSAGTANTARGTAPLEAVERLANLRSTRGNRAVGTNENAAITEKNGNAATARVCASSTIALNTRGSEIVGAIGGAVRMSTTEESQTLRATECAPSLRTAESAPNLTMARSVPSSTATVINAAARSTRIAATSLTTGGTVAARSTEHSATVKVTQSAAAARSSESFATAITTDTATATRNNENSATTMTTGDAVLERRTENLATAITTQGATTAPNTETAATVLSRGSTVTERNPESSTTAMTTQNAATERSTEDSAIEMTTGSAASVGNTRNVAPAMTAQSPEALGTNGNTAAETIIGSATTVGTTENAEAVGTTEVSAAPSTSEGAARLETVKCSTAVQPPESACIICSEMPRDSYFKPCYHIATCSQCAPFVIDCFICNRHVDSAVQLEDCYKCLKKKSNILFKPCNHICVCVECAWLIEKCPQCGITIEQAVNYADLCGFNYLRHMNSANKAASDSKVESDKLNEVTKELDALKEQMLCPVCLDSNRNMIFLCGHGTCKDCGERVSACPLCRKTIQRRVLLF